MKNILLIIATMVVLIGCDSNKAEKESTVDYLRNARAGDMKMLSVNTDNSDKTDSVLVDHPLKQFFMPHGTKALLYIGSFWNSCDTKHQAYTKESCHQAVERGIRIGQSIGIDLEKKDLVDPEYWEQFRVVDRSRIKYIQEHINTASSKRNNNGVTEYQVKQNEFKEKQQQMMQGMDENYGR